MEKSEVTILVVVSTTLCFGWIAIWATMACDRGPATAEHVAGHREQINAPGILTGLTLSETSVPRYTVFAGQTAPGQPTLSTLHGNMVIATYNGNGILATISDPTGQTRPEGAMYHQVIDKYFDRSGKPLEVASSTHVIDPAYCHGGRRDQDLVASIHDDRKGNVWFGEQAPETSVADAH